MQPGLAPNASERHGPRAMKLHASTHGIARRPECASEDAYRINQRDDRVIAVLADGLGSSREGRIAARRAVDMMADYFLARPQAWSPRRALTEFTVKINRVLHEESQIRHGSAELLSTLSVVAIEGGHLYGLNVGDSPIYLWRRGQFTRLSQDHSLAEDGLHHVLTRAVGLEAIVEPFSFETAVEDGDIVLICSDGVSTSVSEARMIELLSRRAPARSFVSAADDAATANPELRDDASAIVLDIVQRGWTGEAQRRNLEVITTLRAGETIDQHKLLRQLQDGGRVWLAENTSGLRHVLKFPPLEAATDEVRRDAFIREVWQATLIDSPDFVHAHIPAEGSLRYYAMEYIDAPTLRDFLRNAPLRVEDAVELGRFLLRACQFLLGRDHAHGDIKPENILVIRHNTGLRFRMLDLGSAAEVFSVTSRAGTPSYLAPERFQGGPLSERSELFAIGVTLYQSLSRTFPYGEVERFQTPRFDVVPKRLSRLNSAVPSWLESVIFRSLAPDANDRYQNFSEMTFDLEHPEGVQPFYRKNAPLLERNPLLFYKLLCLGLLLVNIYLVLRLIRR